MRAILGFASWLPILLLGIPSLAQSDWQTAFASMPLRTNVTELNITNYAPTLLNAFQSNAAVKALVLMPGAVDTFFWNKSRKVTLPANTATLLDAVSALTNQTQIRADFSPPFLLLRATNDPLDAVWKIEDFATADRLVHRPFLPRVKYIDQDWNFLLRDLEKGCGVSFAPKFHSKYSYHFYRNSFAAINLTAWEALQVVALAEQTTFTVGKRKVTFQEDFRPSHPNPPPP